MEFQLFKDSTPITVKDPLDFCPMPHPRPTPDQMQTLLAAVLAAGTDLTELLAFAIASDVRDGGFDGDEADDLIEAEIWPMLAVGVEDAIREWLAILPAPAPEDMQT